MAMKNRKEETAKVILHPLTIERWDDIEQLFGGNSACRSCWCMWWRLSASDWMKSRGTTNKERFRALVHSGKVPGIIAYLNEQPIGWISVAPREEYQRLERSRTLKRIDNIPVWSIVCFFVSKPFRHQGISGRLLQEAVDYARMQRARAIEGYPNKSPLRQQDPLVYTGVVSMFQKLGFKEVGGNSKARTIMRLAL